MKKKFEQLASLPTYGPMYIPITDDGSGYYSEGLAVRFFADTGEEWVANIKPGLTEYSCIHELGDGKHLLVVAGGNAYILNPNVQRPIKSFGGGIDFSQKIDSGSIVLSDGIRLLVVESENSIWSSDRISWDGMVDIKIDDGVVSGRSYSPIDDANEWVDFRYVIAKKELIGGSYPNSYATKRPWWRFW